VLSVDNSTAASVAPLVSICRCAKPGKKSDTVALPITLETQGKR
jgi:hypothetical protein